MLCRILLMSVSSAFSLLATEPVPDFLLEDKNESSPRFGKMVSPRDYRHQVTAYYFGQAN